MGNRFVCAATLFLVSAPAMGLAQQGATPPAPMSPVKVIAPAVTPVPVLPAAPVVATPPTAPAPSAAPVVPVAPGAPSLPATNSDVRVNIGGAAPATGGLAPLPTVELPPGMTVPPAPKVSAASVPPLLPPRPLPPAPPAKLTPAQIAQQIAPNFNVTRDYTRLTQCYGIADFMGAVTRIQASRPGATQQIVGVARSIAGLQDAMQPMVLAASTVRGEARFRADYDAIARNGQRELATSRTPNVTMQRRLATLDACRGDVIRWRGGR
jgi:hypothetical protein